MVLETSLLGLGSSRRRRSLTTNDRSGAAAIAAFAQTAAENKAKSVRRRSVDDSEATTKASEGDARVRRTSLTGGQTRRKRSVSEFFDKQAAADAVAAAFEEADREDGELNHAALAAAATAAHERAMAEAAASGRGNDSVEASFRSRRSEASSSGEKEEEGAEEDAKPTLEDVVESMGLDDRLNVGGRWNGTSWEGAATAVHSSFRRRRSTGSIDANTPILLRAGESEPTGGSRRGSTTTHAGALDAMFGLSGTAAAARTEAEKAEAEKAEAEAAVAEAEAAAVAAAEAEAAKEREKEQMAAAAAKALASAKAAAEHRVKTKAIEAAREARAAEAAEAAAAAAAAAAAEAEAEAQEQASGSSGDEGHETSTPLLPRLCSPSGALPERPATVHERLGGAPYWSRRQAYVPDLRGRTWTIGALAKQRSSAGSARSASSRSPRSPRGDPVLLQREAGAYSPSWPRSPESPRPATTPVQTRGGRAAELGSPLSSPRASLVADAEADEEAAPPATPNAADQWLLQASHWAPKPRPLLVPRTPVSAPRTKKSLGNTSPRSYASSYASAATRPAPWSAKEAVFPRPVWEVLASKVK